MLRSFYLTAGLLVISPILIVSDGPLVQALYSGYVAASVFAVAWRIHPGEGDHLAKVFRPFAIVALIPAAWMLIQVLPLPVNAIMHPVWLGARDALGDSTLGSISIDRGATLVGLSRYLSIIGVMFAFAAVTIDRQRAEWTLLLLAAIATFVATVHLFTSIASVSWIDGSGARTAGGAISALGTIITAAAAIRTFERFEVRRPTSQIEFSKLTSELILCLVGLVICLGAVSLGAARQVMLASVCGIGTLAWALVVRRFALGQWFGAALAVIGIGVVALFVLSQPYRANFNFSLRFATSSSDALLAVVQRMLTDASWRGSGLGSFEALLRIYRVGDSVLADRAAPTTAANFVIELGWPATLAGMSIIAFSAAVLLHGALQRGRDSFYSAAAAGCAVLIALEAFCDASLMSAAVSVIVAAVLGLGTAQRLGRRAQ